MVAINKSGKVTPILPGLLDDSLLSTGSFSFASRLVTFDKLKVLGNVYVGQVNGRPLREAYLFRSALNKPLEATKQRPGSQKRSEVATAAAADKQKERPPAKELKLTLLAAA